MVRMVHGDNTLGPQLAVEQLSEQRRHQRVHVRERCILGLQLFLAAGKLTQE